MRQDVGFVIASKITRLKWWQGILLFWLGAHVVALAALAMMVGLTSAALASPPTCREAPCVLHGGGTDEFKWLGWYINNGGNGLVAVPYEGSVAKLTKASVAHAARTSGLCKQMCSVVAGLAVKAQNVSVSPDAVFCLCLPIGSVSEERWQTWLEHMPADWVAALRSGKPFHWPLRPGEGAGVVPDAS